MVKKRKAAKLNMRVDSDLKTAANKAAVDDRRSLTSWIEKILIDHLKKTGYLKK